MGLVLCGRMLRRASQLNSAEGADRQSLQETKRRLLRGGTPAYKREPHPGGIAMTHITTADGTQIFYKDWGPRSAQPIVFHHGWPLSADDWDAQMLFFLGEGSRVIAHDSRCTGRSSQTSDGNDMD